MTNNAQPVADRATPALSPLSAKPRPEPGAAVAPLACELMSEADEAAWTDYVAAHPGATAYHGLAWRDAVREAFGKPCRYLLARRAGGAVAGVLPLMRQKSLLTGDALVSLPYCNYGGPLADDDAVARALIAAAHAQAQSLGSRRLEIRDLEDRGGDFGLRLDKVSMRLNLPDSVDALDKSFGAKRRSQIRRPFKDGAAVTVGGRENLDEFYRVFSENVRDLGTPVYPRRFFETLWDYLGERCRIVLVRVGEDVAAAGFLLSHGSLLEIPWAGASAKHKRLGVNMLLYREAMAYAIESAHEVFDFGRCTRDSGSYRFKAQWGSETHQLYWVVWPKLAPGEAAAPDSFVRRLWQKLPLPVANWLGPKITSNLPW